MDRFAPPPALHHRLVAPLHVEAMLLTDEARAYFDAAGKHERSCLDPVGRVAFSCESLKLTTRLMHVIAWLLTQRARDAGELDNRTSLAGGLSPAPDTGEDVLAQLPDAARVLVEASIDLYRRVQRLDDAQAAAGSKGPARSMLDRLSASF
jgi:regulator of CtrA degradation